MTLGVASLGTGTLGSNTESISVPVLATITKVSIFPTSLDVVQNQNYAFSANVEGTGAFDSAVTWSTTIGLINSNGAYTPPAPTSVNQTGTVRVQSVIDPTKFALATVNVPAAVVVEPPPVIDVVTGITISPGNTLVVGGSTIKFNALVKGIGNISQAVNWSISAGFIDNNGNAVMPLGEETEQTVIVTATSVQDSSKQGNTSIIIQSTTNENPGSVIIPASRILRTAADDWKTRIDYEDKQGDTFYLSQGVWVINKDPDDVLYYALDINPYLESISASIAGLTALYSGINLMIGPFLRDGLIIAKVGGGDSSMNIDVENSLTFRIACSNGETFDRTIVFGITEH